MLIRTFYVASLLVASLFAHGCKPSETSDSNEQHVFGKTSAKHGHFTPCQEPPASLGYTSTVRYLNDLKNYIAKANGQTFQGMLSPENICIELSTADIGIGGGAFGDSGKIYLERMTVMQAADDSHIAGVMCHELAHVALNHLRSVVHLSSGQKLDFSHGIGPDRYFEVLQKSEAYRREKVSLDGLVRRIEAMQSEVAGLEGEIKSLVKSAIPAELLVQANAGPEGAKKAIEFLKSCDSYQCRRLKANNDRSSKLNQEIFNLKENEIPLQQYNIYKLAGEALPQDVFITWTEREADEAGLEFCVRAGFDPQGSVSRMEKRLWAHDGLNSPAGCRTAVNSALENLANTKDPHGRVAEIPLLEQGQQNAHPQSCWRAFNLQRELRIHASEYRPFIKNLRSVLPGQLEKAQSEIRALGYNR